MSTRIRALTTAVLASLFMPAVHAAVVTDTLGQASFEGCYHQGCTPGMLEPVGLVSSPASVTFWAVQSAFYQIGLTVQADAPVVANNLRFDTFSYVTVTGLATTSVVRDDVSKQLMSVNLAGSFSFSVDVQSRWADGGTVTMSDLTVDVVNRRVTADIVGHRRAYQDREAEDFALENVTMWSFQTLTNGPAVFDPAAALSVDGGSVGAYIVGGVSLATQGRNALARGLGLQDDALGALSSTGEWGPINLNLRYGHAVLSVPEPSSWILMGMGLAGLAMVSRRRRSAGG